jgi:hypothetical protein
MKIQCAIAMTIAGLSAAGAGRAQVDLVGADTIRGWIDIGAAAAPGETAWTRGGFGKLRAGGGSAATEADAVAVWQPRLSDTVQFDITGQAHGDTLGGWGLTETYLRWKPVPTSAFRYAFRIGRFFPPISLENDGPGWTPTRTLTPSAIDTWVGEELLVTGAEAAVRTQWGGQGMGLTAGLFEGADAAGSLLAYRGWALHDLVTAGNAALRLPDTPGAGYEAVFVRQARVARPSVEVDGRGGYYLRGDWQPPAPVALNLVYVYNPGNPTIVERGQYGWTTRMMGGGLVYQPGAADEVLSQYLWGSTKMGAVFPDGRHPADMIFESAYILYAHSLADGGRLSLRGDYFATRDNSRLHLYDNGEQGYAATAAWIRSWTDHLRSALEVVGVTSRRGARDTLPEPDRQSQAQVRLSLRVGI